MTAPVVESCLHGSVKPDLDPDYRFCLIFQHTIFIGATLELIEGGRPGRMEAAQRSRHYAKDLVPTLCVDCGTEITPKASRCAQCSRVLTKIGLGPGPKRRPETVTAEAPRR